MTAVSVPVVGRAETRISKRLWFLVLVAVSAALYVLFADGTVQPRTEDQPLFLAINEFAIWIRDHRDNLVYEIVFGIPRTIVDMVLEGLTSALHAIGWPALIGLFGTLGLLAGGWRLAAFTVSGLVVTGILGLYESSVDTIGAVVAAVAFSYGIGVPLGILVARRPRFRAIITPILDAMQILPTYVYLLPFVLLFGIGPATAAIVTLIYAMPAAIRITALGIRRVPANTIEAGLSMGATGQQMLSKVRIPLARLELGLALNQTIMLAMSMIVITALINAPGLGQDTLRALIRNDVGQMFDAGVAVVVLAIILDRLTEGASLRLDPHRQGALAASLPSRRMIVGLLLGCGILAVAAIATGELEDFPGTVSLSFQDPVNNVVDWLRTSVAWLTSGLKDSVTYTVLNPVETVFTTTPVWLAVGFTAGLALLISGPRPAVVAGICLALVYVIGVWEDAMITLVQVLAATLASFAIGVVLGIASARSDRVQRAMRPVLDVAQTIPSFVYLLPALVLFDPSRFTAIFAAVVFAVPAVIRLVDVGLRSVPPTLIEAATSVGSSGRQVLTKVQLPVARPALQLALNQSVILVLSMIVVGGLVGGGGLGYDVVAGFAQPRLFGMGVAAGIALVLLGFMLDRVSQGRVRPTG